RDFHVTGVQTCALPICFMSQLNRLPSIAFLICLPFFPSASAEEERTASLQQIPIQYEPNRHERELFGYRPKFEPAVVSFDPENQIGRASCRERGQHSAP